MCFCLSALPYYATTSSQSSRSASALLSPGHSCHRTTFFLLSGVICSCQTSLSAFCSLTLLAPHPLIPTRPSHYPSSSCLLSWCQSHCYLMGGSFVSPDEFFLELLSSRAHCFSSVHLTMDVYTSYTFITSSSLSVLLLCMGYPAKLWLWGQSSKRRSLLPRAQEDGGKV